MKKAASSSQSLYRSHRSVPFRNLTCALRYLHTSPTHDAVAHPITAHGPPPTAPLPAVSQYGDRVDRKRKMADLLRQGQEIRATQSRPAGVLRRRFWKDVFVKEVECWSLTGHKSLRKGKYSYAYRRLSGVPRHPACANSFESNPNYSCKQASSCFSHRPRMGSSYIGISGVEAASNPHDINHRSRRGRCATRLKWHFYLPKRYRQDRDGLP